MSDDLPGFTFTEEEIANIKASVGAIDVDEAQPSPISEVRPRRKPGRPRKVPLVEVEQPTLLTDKLPSAPLTKREEREVAVRLSNILTGSTGMLGVVKPYLPMTDEEATSIAEPLASYLIRNEATSGVAREILENYDIVAMMLGVGSYGVRIYSDRKQELREARPINTTATQRVSSMPSADNEQRSNEVPSIEVSVPNASRGGSTPFDI